MCVGVYVCFVCDSTCLGVCMSVFRCFCLNVVCGVCMCECASVNVGVCVSVCVYCVCGLCESICECLWLCVCGYGLCECLRESLCVVYCLCASLAGVYCLCARCVCVCVCECMCVSVSDLCARMCEGLRVVALRVCMWVFWCFVVYVGKCACVYWSVSVLV